MRNLSTTLDTALEAPSLHVQLSAIRKVDARSAGEMVRSESRTRRDRNPPHMTEVIGRATA